MTSRQLLFASILLVVLSVVSSADMEVRRTVSAPGDVVIVLPPDYSGNSIRRVRLDFSVSPQASITALAMWTPQEHNFLTKLFRMGNFGQDGQIMARAAGQSPVVIGARSDTAGGRHFMIIEDVAGSSDTVTLTVSLGWTAGSSANLTSSVTPAVTPAGTPSVPPAITPQVEFSVCRIAGISWRDGGDIGRAVLERDGLRIRFSSPVIFNEEALRKAVIIELGFPGSQDGLLRYEECAFDLKAVADGFIVKLPTSLILTRPTPMRITIDGGRVSSKEGSSVDADGNGMKFPTGDGRPGGIFRSALRIIP